MKPVGIVDCDPGHDDIMAILLAGKTMDLRGITTVFGNVELEKTTRNALQTLEFASLTDVPVAKGMARPLVRDVRHAPEVHGESGIDGPTLPDPQIGIVDQHAVDFIIEQSHQVEDLCLAPVGPLTNIAAALQRDVTLPERIKEISIMGGSLTSGNSTPAAEFNIWCDAEAAHVVFTSGIPIKMLGLNVTRTVLATPERRDQIRKIGNSTGQVVSDLLDFYSGRLKDLFGLAGGSMHDPLAVAGIVEPDMITFEPMHVAIEIHGQHTYGMTVCDDRHLSESALDADHTGLSRNVEPNALVAVAADSDKFWDLFLDILAMYP